MKRRGPSGVFGSPAFMTRFGGVSSCITHIAPAFAGTSLAHANDGAPGVDGTTFEQIETTGLENWLTQLGEELRTQTYRCQAVRRGGLPKPVGGEGPRGVPTTPDRGGRDSR